MFSGIVRFEIEEERGLSQISGIVCLKIRATEAYKCFRDCWLSFERSIYFKVIVGSLIRATNV